MRTARAVSAIATSLIYLVLQLPAPVAQDAGTTKPVSFAILEDYDKGDDLADVEADFLLYDELDIRTWRGSFGWDDYEPSRGQYDLEWLHRFADLAAAHDLTLRPYLGYTPEWAARRGGADADVWNNPPADTARWREFAARMAAELRRHPNVVSYEIYNEENTTQWWDADPGAYRDTLIAGSQAIRSADPDAMVLFGGLVFPDSGWIEQVCGAGEAGGSFGVLPFHAYPETWTPAGVRVENYLDGLDDFVETADEACGRKAIWINETGYATTPGRSERDQANWWVRAVATFVAAPRVEHIGVYEIKDLPLGEAAIGDAPNYHLGLTRTDRTRKLAFYTVDMLTDLLDTGRLTVADTDVEVSAEGAAGELHHHLFVRPDRARVLFVWDRTAASTVAVRVRGNTTSVTELGLDGQPVETGDPADVLAHVRLAAGQPRIFRLDPAPVGT